MHPDSPQANSLIDQGLRWSELISLSLGLGLHSLRAHGGLHQARQRAEDRILWPPSTELMVASLSGEPAAAGGERHARPCWHSSIMLAT
eukprot:scaffold2017_cov387-Prasinococcus_capsulatus_cf.AAC.1